MPDIEPLRFPSREERRPPQTDQVDLQGACSGRRRTCALLNSPLPCVNSAIQHIQVLRAKVDKWFQQPGKYHPQMDLDKHPYGQNLRFQPGDSDSESVMSTELVIEGIGLTPRESSSSSPLLKNINDVLREVVYLIERLEADRQNAEEALLVENRRKKFLENKFDSVSLWMQKEHSFVVQKEHEACLRDITELKWQLRFEKDKLEQLHVKLAQTEMKKQRLHEDINFSTEQIPIVKDNMDFQRSLILQINAEQKEADQLCLKKRANLAMVEKEYDNAKDLAENERKAMELELLSMRNQLAKRKKDLEQLSVVQKAVDADIREANESLAQSKETCSTTCENMTKLTQAEKTCKDEISKIKIQSEEEMRKNTKLQKKLISLMEDLEKARLKGEADVSSTKEQLVSAVNAFNALRKENLDSEEKVEDYKTKIYESKKAVKQMREERRQMLQKISDNDEQWERAKEEVTLAVAQHSATQDKLEVQERLTFMEEEKARKRIESLRRDLTNQITAVEQLEAQCATINDEMYHHRRAAKETNLKLQREFEEASSVMKSLESRTENLKALIKQLEDLESEHRRTLDSLNKEKLVKQGQLQAAKDLLAATLKRYETTVDRTSELTKQNKEFHQDSDQIQKALETMPAVIEELKSVFAVVEFKNKSGAFIMNTLQSDINNCLQRTQRSMQVHTAHVTARKKKMEDTKEELTAALSQNQQLARTYEHLTEVLLETKQEAVSALTDKSSAQRSFLYYTQLSLLQKRMHKALVKYFKQRSVYSQAELDQCQALSRETDQKIKTAQEWLVGEIHAISAFLQSFTDGSTSRDESRVSRQVHSDATESNK
ncbi:coiled-coil domain-containing protein 178 [Periophthalmus magnuspinnatus]|uniref:coiled-coil domain-containing protein 178 n=1 Tax=Periophthalmus magnuspinnatus TaxID=409849 RepID=UPI002437433C|nr:coiled-coil domain-containing protein 178 [Periophthalmus magnuspinnatus]